MNYDKRVKLAEENLIEIKKHIMGLVIPIIGVVILAVFYNLLLFTFPFLDKSKILFKVLAIGGNIFIMLILALLVIRWYYNRYYAKGNSLVIITLFTTSEVTLVGRRFEVVQSVIDRMLNKGTLILSDSMSRDTSHPALILKNIKDPYKTISEIVSDSKDELPDELRNRTSRDNKSDKLNVTNISDKDRKEFEEFLEWKKSREKNKKS